MKKRLLFVGLLCGCALWLNARKSSFDTRAAGYFNEIRKQCAAHYDLWDFDLYGPLLMVDPETRKVYANYADKNGALKPQGDIFMGILPQQVNIANTALDWNGKRWAMVILPLPEDKHARIDLLAHELFHRAQPALGFHVTSPHNNHLDEKNGRVFLRLELEALMHALNASQNHEKSMHLTHAMTFRKYRHSLYPGAAESENLLEINEGIASYTGIVMSGRNDSEIVHHFQQLYEQFQLYPTFVSSFAYLITPLYGYLLRQNDPLWNKQLDTNTDLTRFFSMSFHLTLPAESEEKIQALQLKYRGEEILKEENNREALCMQIVAEYKARFIDNPHLVIPFENMSISFNPTNLVPFEGHGTVYPTLRVTDQWGILQVEKGALLGANWDRVTVCQPKEIGKKTISGKGWVLEINRKYEVVKNADNDHYLLKKR